MGRIPYFYCPIIEGFPKETIFGISFSTKQGFHFDKIVQWQHIVKRFDQQSSNKFSFSLQFRNNEKFTVFKSEDSSGLSSKLGFSPSKMW